MFTGLIAWPRLLVKISTNDPNGLTSRRNITSLDSRPKNFIAPERLLTANRRK